MKNSLRLGLCRFSASSHEHGLNQNAMILFIETPKGYPNCGQPQMPTACVLQSCVQPQLNLDLLGLGFRDILEHDIGIL